MRINPPSDPHFKDKIEFPENSPPTKKWQIVTGIFVIAGIVAGAIYFYPNVTQYINTFSQPKTADSPSRVTPEATAPTAHEDSSDTREAAPNTTLTESEAAPSKQGVPAVEQDTVTSMSVQPVVPSVEPAAIPSVPAKPVDTSVQPVITSTESSTESTETAERLLAEARKQIELERFTSPAGDNAYETYQALLKIAPQQAQEVLETLVAWYFKQAKKYLSKNPLTQRTRNKAYKMYQKLSEIAPQHQSTQTLSSDIIDMLTLQAKRQFQKKRLTTPKNDNAYTTYQQMLIVAPSSRETQRLLKTLVDRLLAQALRQMENSKYTRPENDNATDTYHKVLKISPDNAEAQNGINKIAMRYYKLAETKKRLGRFKASMTWIERGLQVAPDNPELNQLKQEVLEELSQ
jgi:ribosomal protein L22